MSMCDEAIDPLDPESFEFTPIEADSIILNPGQFILASSLERIELSPDVTAKVHGKSSLGRLGLINSSHAGWIDGGFRGFITLELSNTGPFPIRLTAGMKIGQLVFQTTEIPDKDYTVTGRYVDQSAAFGSKGV